MKSTKHIINTCILIGILLFLFIPVIQSTFHLKQYIKPLKGAYTEAKDTVFTSEGWFSGRYHEIKDKYLNQNFGLRNYYVMLNNQINYNYFDIANIDRVVVGKQGFLYETDYIDAYYGNNFIGTEQLISNFKKIKDLQEKLAAIGKDLEIVFLPSKASFYPEYIPNRLVQEKKISNYDCAVALCKKLKIEHIDFSNWFIQLKATSPYDLYPRTGIHWSNYGALLATDSLKKHIEFSTKTDLRDFLITNVTYSDSLLAPDNDMGEVMNLLFPVKTVAMPYASYYWTEDKPTTVRPKALVIADSYYWNIYTQGLANNLFTDNKYWYYNQTVYPESEPVREVNKLNLLDEIKKQQVIILMATEINVHDIGWGFVDKALEALGGKGTNSLRQKAYVSQIKEQITKTAQWMEDIKKKAAERNISVDEMITLDAIYIYETEYSTPEVVKQLEEAKIRIKNTKEWMEQIKIKAKEKNMPEEEMLELDVKYLYDTEIKDK